MLRKYSRLERALNNMDRRPSCGHSHHHAEGSHLKSRRAECERGASGREVDAIGNDAWLSVRGRSRRPAGCRQTRSMTASSIFTCERLATAKSLVESRQNGVLGPLTTRRQTSEAGKGGLPDIRSAAFSAIISTAALILPPTRSGKTDASTTRRASIPRTRRSQSTTADSSC
jgi:hypothetical protein